MMSEISVLSALDRPDTATFCLPKLNNPVKKLPSLPEDEATQVTEEPVEIECKENDDHRETVKPHEVIGVELDDNGVHQVEFNPHHQIINFVDVEAPNKTPSPSPKSPKYVTGSRPVTAPHDVDILPPHSRPINTATPRSRDSVLA